MNTFVDMVAARRRPTLYFLHVLLPHVPWIFYPSSKAYAEHSYEMDSLVAGAEKTTWMDDEFLVAQGLRRHLLQVQLVDRFVSRLVNKMKEERIYDSSLIVVTADHGVGFNPGWVRRESPNRADIYLVPMFIKYPGQAFPVARTSLRFLATGKASST